MLGAAARGNFPDIPSRSAPRPAERRSFSRTALSPGAIAKGTYEHLRSLVAAAPPVSQPSGTLRLRLPDGPWIELLYAEGAGGLFVIPSEGSTTWAAAVLRAGEVRVRTPDGEERTLRADLVLDPMRAEQVRILYRGRYGPATWDRYFARSGKVIELRRAARRVPPTREERVVSEFDAVAPRYRAQVESNPFERYLKRRSVERLRATFAGRDPLLEVGPGAGLETLPLLAAGHRVTAVDVSDQMLAELDRGARDLGLAACLTCRKGAWRSLGPDLEDCAPATFSGAYSTFGALNLEPELASGARGLARLLPPGAPFVAGVLNRFGLFPLAYEFLRGGPAPVRARLARPIPAERIRYPLDVWAWTPGEYDRQFAPYFERTVTHALSCLVPPFRADRFLRKFDARARGAAVRWDRRLSQSSWGTATAEWLLLEYRRTRHPPPG